MSKSKQEVEMYVFSKGGKGDLRYDVEFSNVDLWQEEVRLKKGDPLGDAIMAYTERWALLMQRQVCKGNKIEDVADKTSRQAYDVDEGITTSGLLRWFAVDILSRCWKYGKQLRCWYNTLLPS